MRARESLASVPPLLASKSHRQLAEAWASSLPDLEQCADRGDGWLFHELTGDLLRGAYVAWFAAHAHYCPFPKHLRAWADRLALDPHLVDLERHLWNGTLPERLSTLTTLVEGILRLDR